MGWCVGRIQVRDNLQVIWQHGTDVSDNVTSRMLAAIAAGMILVATAQGQVPADTVLNSLRPAADVSDFAGILSPAEKAALEQRCRTLREKTGAQLAVVTIQSLEGGQIDDFSNKLFARWGIGEKGKNNGILLLVAMEDRKARIEVGYGLEPILPDALAGRILEQRLFPAFKQKRYAEGLSSTVNQLCEIVERGEKASAVDRRPDGQPPFFPSLMIIGVLTLFVALGSFVGGMGLRSRTAGQILFGAIFAGGPLLIGLFVAPALAAVLHLPTGLLMGWLGWRSGPANRQPKGSSWSRPVSPWTWVDTVGSSGGFSDWSSSGGGGFSSDWGGFGGGSSGGGGASGGW